MSTTDDAGTPGHDAPASDRRLTDETLTSIEAEVHGRTPVSREQTARVLAHLRELHEDHDVAGEGLRERKKRLTRQLISDTATWMFIERGFDAVRVSEVAAEVGVSEKTVFNYFPTKESLVFDREDDLVRGIREALTRRRDDETPTEAMLGFIEQESAHMDVLDDEFRPMILAFVRMIDETPALRVARHGLSAALTDAVREALAERVGVDPHAPEPSVAARALVGLWDLQIQSRQRRLQEGVPFAEVHGLVMADTRRAARLLDDGLGAFDGAAGGVANAGT